MQHKHIYGGRDPRDLPAYTVADAAKYLYVPPATLRSWFVGRTYPRKDGGAGSFKPLLAPAGQPGGAALSFFNLVEAHVLRALRTEHGIALREVRAALDFAENELKIPRVLLSDALLTGAGEVFLEHYGNLVSLSRSGQLAIRRTLELYLRRVDRDDRHIPLRLRPFLTAPRGGGDTIVIDPLVSFGRPVVAGSGITTRTLVQRVDAGETVEHLVREYGLTAEEIGDAIMFEKAA
jgi:uncharacterized protein (DUF433 family)